MIFHETGEKGNPVIVIIHGALTPWQICLPIAEHFKDSYRIIMPALSGHTAEEKSNFTTIESEAKEIEDYIIKEYSGEAFALFGFSMGGAIANEILKNKRIKVKNVILDGAPLVPAGKLLTAIMTKQYVSITEKSKTRDKRTLSNFSKSFLPAKYLQDYLAFIDNTSTESVRNMLSSVCKSTLATDLSLKSTKLLYIHGTKVNEMLSKKSARLIAKLYPEACVVSFKGDRHCQCAIYEPEDWAKVADDYINNR